MNDERQPLTISVKRDGSVYIQETPIALADLAVRLKALAGDGLDRPIYVRADGGAPYSYVAQVMAKLSTSGFTKIDLITDTGPGTTSLCRSRPLRRDLTAHARREPDARADRLGGAARAGAGRRLITLPLWSKPIQLANPYR